MCMSPPAIDLGNFVVRDVGSAPVRDPLFTRETTRALLPSSLLRGGRASRVRSHLTESWEGPELTLLGPWMKDGHPIL